MLGHQTVNRLGYGAMQLAGPGVFGPPRDKAAAVAVLREAVQRGINHIDTSDFYGPHITNQLIREALHPYPADLVIVTKVGAIRGPTGTVHPAMGREQLTQAVEDNLRNLGVDVLDVVNLRSMLRNDAPAEGSLEESLTVMADLQRKGLIRHIGLSNVTAAQVAQGRSVCNIVCVQNLYNLADRGDEGLVQQLALERNRVRSVFPTRRDVSFAIGNTLKRCATARRDAHAGGARLAAATRAEYPTHPRYVITRPSPREHRRGNPDVAAKRHWRIGHRRTLARRNRRKLTATDRQPSDATASVPSVYRPPRLDPSKSVNWSDRAFSCKGTRSSGD